MSLELLFNLFNSIYSLSKNSFFNVVLASGGDAKNVYNFKWEPTPVFLPGESHGQRSRLSRTRLTESDTTERLHFTSSVLKWGRQC